MESLVLLFWDLIPFITDAIRTLFVCTAIANAIILIFFERRIAYGIFQFAMDAARYGLVFTIALSMPLINTIRLGEQRPVATLFVALMLAHALLLERVVRFFILSWRNWKKTDKDPSQQATAAS